MFLSAAAEFPHLGTVSLAAHEAHDVRPFPTATGCYIVTEDPPSTPSNVRDDQRGRMDDPLSVLADPASVRRSRPRLVDLDVVPHLIAPIDLDRF